MADRSSVLSAASLRSVLDQLSLAIFIFRGERLIYTNPPATRLVQRLRNKYRIELLVMLHDHLAEFRESASAAAATFASLARDKRSQQAGTVMSLTGQDNEPFIVRLFELSGRRDDVAVSVREIGTDISAFRDRYRLSRRETQVAELVLRGHRNSHIAAALGIAPATIKKHLSSIFDKVGVTSRAQLASKLA
ncbi:MAG TPA: helix-turn-helix transcriptional regulator [Vicinamibacterales bacterium]|nr:helix-turn-helix transcriptional regulator [Vicinamibacterales bacterium]